VIRQIKTEFTRHERGTKILSFFLFVLLCGAAVEAKPDTFPLRDYNVTFDLGDIPYEVSYSDRGQGGHNSMWIEYNDHHIINVTNFDGDDEIVPDIDSVGIKIDLGGYSRMVYDNTSEGRAWRNDTRFQHTELDELNRWNIPDGGWKQISKKSVYKTIQIDGQDGRILTDINSRPVATYLIPPEGRYVRISAYFGGGGMHLSLDSTSSEEIAFKVAYLENFLKTLHIEKSAEGKEKATV